VRDHSSHARAETVALDLTCAECKRSPQRGEVWSIYYADIGEAVTYCPECAEREFGGS
jgi:ribosomal protein L44E